MKPEKEKKPSVFQRLTPYMGKRRVLFPLSYLLSVISAVTGVLPFVYIRRVVYEVMQEVTARDYVAIRHAAWMALFFAVLTVVIYFFALMVSHFAAFQVEIGLQEQTMRRIFAKPLGYFSTRSVGKIRKVVQDGAGATHSFLAHNLPDVAGAVVTPVILLVLMFVIDWRLGLACLLPTICGYLIMAMMQGRGIGKEFQKKYFDSLEEMSAESVEYVRAIPVVKTFGQSIHSFKRFYGSIINYRDWVSKYTIAWRKPYSLYTTVMQGAAFCLVPVAILILRSGGATPETVANFVFFLVIAPTFAGSMMRIMYLDQNKMMVTTVLDRLDGLLDFPEAVYGTEPVSPENADLCFEGVSFTYDGATGKAVDNVSFTVPTGKTVALVGMSGGGKTTVARLAARFRDADAGKISIGGVPIRDYPKKQLMDTVAFVFQNTKLFKKTILENITYGTEDYTREALDAAIDMSQSREIIDALPEGFDTMIGHTGTFLSGGEQQRIALARAILKDAPVILLDEATAFADPENEQRIQKALQFLRQGKTCLMIAHRLSGITDVDEILVMDAGRIVQRGTHAELAAIDGPYRTMWTEYRASADWTMGVTKGGDRE
ncbi:MAG: ABC transporter ATP-binding protein [Eubacteriales bacterium]|nr:ABC transporter ATP-binding protein [Eubacteriales bacterium]